MSVCLADRVLNYMNLCFTRLEGIPKNYGFTGQSNVHITQEIKDSASEIYKSLRGEMIISNSNPKSIAAAIVYLACVIHQSPVSQKDINKTLGTNVATIRKYAMKINRMSNIGITFPSAY